MSKVRATIKKSKKSSDGGSEKNPAAMSEPSVARPPEPPQSPDDGSGNGLNHATRCMARSSGPPDIPALCISIQEDQVERKFSIQMEAAIVQRISARVVRAIGLDHEATEVSRKAAWTRAERIVRRALQGAEQEESDRDIAAVLAGNLAMSSVALKPVSAFRDQVEARMRAKAELLPAFALTQRTPGFKAIGLAVIVGEAGDLSNYATVRKLWRRLGLGMAPGHEAHAYSTWKRIGLPTGEWDTPEFPGQPLRAGYSPKRLGQIYGVVTVPLVMMKAKNRYGEIYAARRAHTAITHPTGTITECNADPNRWTPGHSHADAQRVMTKALISDLWSEWRGSAFGLKADDAVAPAELVAAE